MQQTPDNLSLDPVSARLSLHGDWTLAHYARLSTALRPPAAAVDIIDGSDLREFDTAGAAVLVSLLGAARVYDLAAQAEGFSDERRALLLAVAASMRGRDAELSSPGWKPGQALALLGARVVAGWQALLQFLGFLGLTLSTLALTLPRPWRWRGTALVAQMQQVGVNAVPIIVLLNFLVGVVVALLGATVLEDFGATIYTVDLVAYAFMRELGVLLAAILLAGRTASAFTAQIGSMKLNGELDALQVQGLSVIELLVLPRLLAMVLMLPLLTFLAMLAGMVGGAMVALFSLEITLSNFMAIVQEIPVRHLLLGLGKAPFFAVVIALIGCLEGLKVAGSAQSLGEHTTSSVVQSIFAVILLDAVAALFFMEMGW